MGVGLIEPVDSISDLPNAQHQELVKQITAAIVALKFDEPSFLAVLLKTRLYQSESVRDTPKPGVPSDLRGPWLRRLSAEQVWDSCLTLIVPDLDERASLRRTDASPLDPSYLRKLQGMSADEIIARARDEMEYRIRQREFQLRQSEQVNERAAARARGDTAKEKALLSAHAKENESFFSPRLEAMQMGGAYFAEETDPRWKHLPDTYIRASEIPLPLALGHFLQQFGQSDRREIDAFNRDPNTTHSLALMNGELTSAVIAKDSALQHTVEQSKLQGDALTQLLYRAVLVRQADSAELAQLAVLTKRGKTPANDLIWALLNTPEFLHSMNAMTRLTDPHRRQFIKRFAKTCFGVSIASALPAMAQTRGPGGKAKSVICLYLRGGISHIDTLDPKPGKKEMAGVEAIKTSADGVQVSEWFPRFAKQMHHVTLVRSMTSTQGIHELGAYSAHTSYFMTPTIKHPALGTWAVKLLGPRNKVLPGNVLINGSPQHPGCGYMESHLAPLPIVNPADGLQNSVHQKA